jgi:succinate dehydrogenase / fumarate reductase iron-sulfur subunit
MQIKFKVFRFDPEKNEEAYYDIYEINANLNERILDVLNRIRWEHDPTLSYRWSCVHGICGSDGLTINGVSSLACQKLIKEYKDVDIIQLDPLSFFPIIKDLVVDMEPFFQCLKWIHPKEYGEISPVDLVQSIQNKEDRQNIDNAISCVMCACCVSVCPVNLEEDPKFIGPAAGNRKYRYIFDSRIQDKEKRLKIANLPHGVMSCKQYARCTMVCPKGIKITRNIVKVKRKLS